MKTGMAENFIRIQQAGKVPSLPFVFKKGQVITGRILNVYPHQQAEIQIGDTRLTAQLHASLNKEQKYWFQVESIAPFLRLKVLEDSNASKKPDNIKQLLSSLGIKGTKDGLHAAQLVLDSKIPLKRDQLLQIIQLIDKVGLKKIDNEVIKEILHRNLPVSTTTYQAIKTKNSYSLTQQLTGILMELKSLEKINPLQNKLLQKVSGIMPMEKDFTLTNELRNISGENVLLNSASPGNGSDKSITTTVSALRELLRDQLPITESLKKQLIQFSNLLVKASGTNGTNEDIAKLNDLNSHLMKNRVFTKIMTATGHPLAFSGQGIELVNFKSVHRVDKETVSLLQKLASRQLNHHSEVLLINTLQKAEEAALIQNPKLSFLSQLKNQSIDLGLNYKYESLSNQNEKNSVEQSLKNLLLQTSGTSNMTKLAEKIDMLLQTITGLQLTSVSGNDDFLQFNIQIPGNSFGLQEDIHLNFESRKDKNGDVDSSYCRILFYLNLRKLEETMVDMNIIDRKINLTIYNTNELEKVGKIYRPFLEEGLQKLDYSLASLQFKILNSEKIKETNSVKDKSLHYSKGVDFRI